MYRSNIRSKYLDGIYSLTNSPHLALKFFEFMKSNKVYKLENKGTPL